jgi:hypothetical protein
LTHELGEGTSGHFHHLSFVKGKIEANIPIEIGGGDEILHHSVWDRLRLAAIHKQAIDAQSSIDAAPAVSCVVDDHEEISRKKWLRDRLDLPRVPAILPIAWHEAAEALIGKLPRGMKFALRQRTGDIPALVFRGER